MAIGILKKPKAALGIDGICIIKGTRYSPFKKEQERKIS